MEFTAETKADHIVISLIGSFTFKDHHGFQRSAGRAECNRHRPAATLDLSKVDFLDSAALGMLMIAEDDATRAQGC